MACTVKPDEEAACTQTGRQIRKSTNWRMSFFEKCLVHKPAWLKCSSEEVFVSGCQPEAELLAIADPATCQGAAGGSQADRHMFAGGAGRFGQLDGVPVLLA